MHLEDEQIQRLLHRELDAYLSATVSGHLAQCERCRGRLEEARREEEWIIGLVRRLDEAVPPLDAAAVLTRARSRTRAWGVGRWAAALLVLAGAAGVAYAVPGSPLPGWIRRVAGEAGGPTRQTAGPASPSRPASAGVAVTPGERFTIVFRARQEGMLAVSLVDGPDLTLRARHGAPTFTTELHGLAVENEGSRVDYDLELPRGAPWVEVRTGRRRLLLKQGDSVIATRPAEVDGSYLIPLEP